MAMITCIECGKSISSFAASCPNCGCPAEMQRAAADQTRKVTANINTLKQPMEWAAIYGYVERGDIDSAIKKIIQISGADFFEAQRIIDRMITSKSIPIEYITTIIPTESKSTTTTTPCTACHRPISTKAETCPHCGNPTGVHVCPKCGSTNTHVIVGVDKAISVALWGRFAANEVMSKYACYDCKHKW